MKFQKTNKGFDFAVFTDRYHNQCSIQKSSLATEDAIWIGVNNPNPQIMASKTSGGGEGWVPYPIPDHVSINTRMHLTQQQVREIMPILQRFVDTGDLL